MFFLIQSWSRQKYGRWSWTDSMTGKKGYTSVLPLQKVSRGMKKKTKKTTGNIVTNIKYFYLEIWGCYVMGNVDVIIQSEADQTDKILNYFPWSEVSWEAFCGLNTTLKGNQSSHLVWMSRQLAGGMSDSAPEEEKLFSTCCFLSVFQKGWRGRALALHCIMPADSWAGATKSNTWWIVSSTSLSKPYIPLRMLLLT